MKSIFQWKGAVGLLAMAAQGLAVKLARATPTLVPRGQWTEPAVAFRSRSRRYPEQSLRQENRRFRRAQGGPGLWEAKDCEWSSPLDGSDISQPRDLIPS